MPRTVTTRKYRKKSYALPVIISLALITGVSLGVAFIWQSFQDSGKDFILDEASSLPDREPSQNSLSGESSQSGAVSAITAASSESSLSDDEPPDEASTGESSAGTDVNEPDDFHPPRDDYPNAVKASEKVPSSYFDDAVFFGDSISTGILNYNIMPNTDVVAYIGISTVNAVSKKCIETDAGLETMLEAAARFGDKKKVYIMLGGNGLSYDKEAFIGGYVQFLDAVKQQYPKAVIYVQTMPPVTDYAYKTYPSVNNDIINEYNLAIHEMAKSEKVNLVDTACAFMDENGKLPDKASPVDGMHFGPEYYHRWFEYLKSHTVK